MHNNDYIHDIYVYCILNNVPNILDGLVFGRFSLEIRAFCLRNTLFHRCYGKYRVSYLSLGVKSQSYNYRPASLTSHVCNVMVAIIGDAIVDHLQNHDMIKAKQL